MFRHQTTKGFTIIELVLFLAISALMLVGILVSSGTSVSEQRYKDTVYSLQSTLQDQYTETFNTRNSITSSVSCSPDGSVTFVGSLKRGQTSCVLLGKYVTPSDDGKKLLVYSVVGYQSSTPSGFDDLSIFQSYSMKTLPISLEEVNVEWGISMQKDTPASPITFTLMILRSPDSGVIRTFVSNNSNSAITNAAIVNSESMSRSLLICMDSNDLTTVGRRLGVKVLAGASSTTGVEFVSADSKVGSGGCS